MRRLAAKLLAINSTATPLLMSIFSLLSYNLAIAGENLVGLSNSLGTPGRAPHIDKIQSALGLPREYTAQDLDELRNEKLRKYGAD